MTFMTEEVPGPETLGPNSPPSAWEGLRPPPHSAFPLPTNGPPSGNCTVVRYYENKNEPFSFVAIDFCPVNLR